MPHLLIAGSTGTGKSVALNALIASLMYKATPEEVKIVLIDPKRLEFTLYEDIPHLLCPVINDPKKAHIVLMDIVRKMEERYKKLQGVKVRNIDQYNTQMRQLIAEKKGQLTDEEKEKLQPLPYIVIIIDELAELMMVGAQEVEFFIGRLAQLARAVGIHLVMATQRPSIDVITGTIKNNFSCRIAFRVPSKVDSRIIIDTIGADKLLGMGDMLFLPPNFPRLVRLHCSFISIPEVRRLVKHVKSQGTPTYDTRILHVVKGDVDHAMRGRRREGRALREGRRDRPPQRPGLGLLPPAAAQARLRPGGPDHRPDGGRGPHRPVRGEQAAGDPRRPQGVLQGQGPPEGRRRRSRPED